MITATYTNPRTHESIEVEVLGTNDYLPTRRFEIHALQGEPFTEYNSEGYPLMTAYNLVMRNQLTDIKRDGVPVPYDLTEATAEACKSLEAGRLARIEMCEDAIEWLEMTKTDSALSAFDDEIIAGYRLAAGNVAWQVMAHH